MLNKIDETFMMHEENEILDFEHMINSTQIENIKSNQIHKCNDSNIDNNSSEFENLSSQGNFDQSISQNYTSIDKNIFIEKFPIDDELETNPLNKKMNDEQNDIVPHKKGTQKNPFTYQEDKVLLSLVNSVGEKNWVTISMIMKQMNYDRNGRQCRDRYYHYLDPKINNDASWSPEEEDLLVKTVEKNGKKWKWMEKIFPGRTEVSLRNRYHLIIRKKIKKENQKARLQNNIMSSNYDFLDKYAPTRKTQKITKKKEIPQKETNENQNIQKSINSNPQNQKAEENSSINNKSIINIFNESSSISLFDEDVHELFSFNNSFFI